MSAVSETKSKVQRMLVDLYGSVEIDRDEDFVVRKGSAVTFVRVREGFGDGTLVDVKCPILFDAPLTPELFKWVATEGQEFKLGGVWVNPNEDGKTGWVYFRYAITGDDLDESELQNAVGVVVSGGDRLDNELQERFGGEIFGSD
jgi:hypothetical protein